MAESSEPESTTARLAAHLAERAAKDHPGATLDRLLAHDLPGNALNSLLLHALRERSRRRGLSEVREHLERAQLTQPGRVDARKLNALDALAFASAAEFEAVELSPVMPLGTSACAGVDPNNVLTATRHVEAASDPATGLALAAALRRKANRAGGPVRLCASQRVTRMQPFDNPNYWPHFRLFALASAARSGGAGEDAACERRELLGHLRAWGELARRLGGAGYRVAGLRVVLSDTWLVRAALTKLGADPTALARRARAGEDEANTALLVEAGVSPPRAAPSASAAARELGLHRAAQSSAEALEAEVAEPLRQSHPEVAVAYDLGRLQGLTYYQGPFIQLHVRRDDGAEFALGDGGAVPWLRGLLGDARERLVATGLAPEAVVALFSPA